MSFGIPSLIFCVLALLGFSVSAAAEPDKRPRLIVLTDIGGDPDDQQSMTRLMTHANDFDIEGLIASASGTPGELKGNVVRPDLIREIVQAYGQVRPNLLQHAPGYPPADRLVQIIKSGNPNRGVANLGADHDTEGSNWIINVVDREDPRPVNIVVWGGTTELAQALWRVRNDRTPEQLQSFLAKIRVHDIDHQDDTGPWIDEHFPTLFYILSKSAPEADKRSGVYRGMYLGGDESLTSRQWITENIKTDHGPLGAMYPMQTWTDPNPHGCLKEGDTPSWFYFLDHGLSDPAHPEWGSWGGRFARQTNSYYRDAKDKVGEKNDGRATVWRWRPAYQADFAARMDWCTKPYDQANHHPIAVLNGDSSRQVMRISAGAGESVKLSAEGSTDPDGNAITCNWWLYTEAGSYGKSIPIAEGAQTTLAVPKDAAGKTIHVILEVKDDGEPALTAYRRTIIDVRP